MDERRMGFGWWVLVALTTGCAGEGSDASAAVQTDASTLSWEAFKERVDETAHIADGERYYVVEWDLRVHESELESYYIDRYVQTHKSTLSVLNGVDNVLTWPKNTALTYCVSDAFAADHARIVAEMARATDAWASQANLIFQYRPEENDECVDANPRVEIPVVVDQDFILAGCSFFPTNLSANPPCTGGRVLALNIYLAGLSNVSTEGVLRHELGHIFGLRHEHIREANNAIPDTNCRLEYPATNFRALTPYDRLSAMHYPHCDGVNDDLRVTALDGEGVNRLYGVPVWYTLLL